MREHSVMAHAPEEIPIPVPVHKEKKHLDYYHRYQPTTLILFFFSFSFIGWVWEVMLHVVKDGVFVNRGTLWGPWLPIYGVGAVLALILLKKFFKSPVLTFFLVMIIASIVEYFSSWWIEHSKGIRYWDYSNYPLNINGRICLEGAVIFGLGGCAVIYFVGPKLAQYYEKIPMWLQIVLCAALLAAFCADEIYTHFHPHEGAGITDYDAWKQKGIEQQQPPAQQSGTQ